MNIVEVVRIVLNEINGSFKVTTVNVPLPIS